MDKPPISMVPSTAVVFCVLGRSGDHFTAKRMKQTQRRAKMRATSKLNDIFDLESPELLAAEPI